MFSRQCPSHLSGQEAEKWKSDKQKWIIENESPDKWPWSVLQTFLGDNNLIKAGSREVQVWRVKEFLLHPLPNIKHIIKRYETPPLFLRFPHRIRKTDEPNILNVPKDVLKNKILIHLIDSPLTLFSLMMTCKDMQGVCQEALCILAQQEYGPNGTPMALMCASHYMNQSQLLQKKPSKKKRKTLSVPTSVKKDLLKNLYVSETKWIHGRDVYDSIKATIIESIKQNGCIDGLIQITTAKEQHKKAKELEITFVKENTLRRISYVNEYFQNIMHYKGLDVVLSDDGERCEWKSKRTESILYPFSERHHQQVYLLENIEQWVFMKTNQSLTTVCNTALFAPVDLFNVAFTQCTLPTVHPLVKLILENLLEIRARGFSFYGGIMTEQDWFNRLAYIFSSTFEEKTPPFADGSWLCCWKEAQPEIELYYISEHVRLYVHDYVADTQLLRQKNNMFLGSPATNIAYHFKVPTHFIGISKFIALAHCILK